MEVVGKGTYACVVKGDICPLHPPSASQQYVSKIVYDEVEANNVRISMQLAREIDPKQDFLVYPTAECDKHLTLPPKCLPKRSTGGSPNENTKTPPTLNQLTFTVFTMPAGIPLVDYIKSLPMTDDNRKAIFISFNQCINWIINTLHKHSYITNIDGTILGIAAPPKEVASTSSYSTPPPNKRDRLSFGYTTPTQTPRKTVRRVGTPITLLVANIAFPSEITPVKPPTRDKVLHGDIQINNFIVIDNKVKLIDFTPVGKDTVTTIEKEKSKIAEIYVTYINYYL